MSELDEALTLARLRREHPGWTVGPSDAGPVWEAITRPSPTAVHVVVGRTLGELAVRLDAADRRPMHLMTPEQLAEFRRLLDRGGG